MSAEAEPLLRALSEIESHVASQGWDQSPRLYALAPTAELLAREPALASQLGLDPAVQAPDSLTPIEQEVPMTSIDDLLATITWPETVAGCALVVERIVLPPAAEDTMPHDPDAATSWAQNHPKRTDVRIVVGVLRDGRQSSVMRVRGHDDESDLIRDPEFSPDLGAALAATFS
jgi:hypothetical protein